MKDIEFEDHSVSKTKSFKIQKDVDSENVMEFFMSFINKYDEDDRS